VSAEPLPTRLPDPGECPDCAAARALLMEERIRRQDAEKDLAGKRAQITKLKDELAGKRKSDPLYDTAFKCWSYWKAKCKPKARKMSDEQLKALLKVLKAKLPDSDEYAYPPRYVCEAILGCAGDHFVDGKGKHHNGLELICSKIEEMHERYERARA
jgi:hypothetical protein